MKLLNVCKLAGITTAMIALLGCSRSSTESNANDTNSLPSASPATNAANGVFAPHPEPGVTNDQVLTNRDTNVTPPMDMVEPLTKPTNDSPPASPDASMNPPAEMN
jgi:hypothetical protein